MWRESGNALVNLLGARLEGVEPGDLALCTALPCAALVLGAVCFNNGSINVRADV